MTSLDRTRPGLAWAVVLAVGCGLALCGSLQADEAAVAAREISRKWGDAVLTTKVVIKARWVMEGREADEGETTGEVNATVIDPSGLLVCSLSQVDPSQRVSEMEEDEDYRFEAEIRDLKIIRPDGREIPAKVALRDRDLDLAFIRPTEQLTEPLVGLDLADSAAPDVLDQIVILSRLGQTGNRTKTVAVDRITAILEKPRTFYIGGANAYFSGLGCPVFALGGKVVGIVFVRSAPSGAADRGRGGAMPVILPAAQILEVAAQVPKE